MRTITEYVSISSPPNSDVTGTAATDLSAKRWYLVGLSSSLQVDALSAAAGIAGILVNAPTAGETATVRLRGIGRCIAAGTISRHDWLKASGSPNLGKVATWSSGDAYIVGYALEDATAGDAFLAFVSPQFISAASSATAYYGACYGNEIAWSQSSASQDVWYTIADTDMSDGALSGVTHDGSGKLTVTATADYMVSYSITMECSQANKHLEASIAIDGTEQSAGQCHIEIGAANTEYVLTNQTLLSLTSGQTVEVSIRTNDTGSPTLSVDDFNLSVVAIGAAGATTGAPTGADYLVKTANASLTAERVVTDTTSVTWDWATAGQAKAAVSASWLINLIFPVGAIYHSKVSTNPGTLFGVGTWVPFGPGRCIISLDSGDADFDTVGETGGAKTVAAAGTISDESAHTHGVTSNVAVAAHTLTGSTGSESAHTHGATGLTFTGNAVAAASTQSSPDLVGSVTTGAGVSPVTTATGSIGGSTAAGSSHSHDKGTIAVDAHSVTNNAVTSGAGSAHSHIFTGSATSVVQPYIVAYVWERTA